MNAARTKYLKFKGRKFQSTYQSLLRVCITQLALAAELGLARSEINHWKTTGLVKLNHFYHMELLLESLTNIS